MKFVLRPAARQDMLNQFFYLIDEGSPHLAERFINAVEETISKLSKNPYIGAPKKLKDMRLQGLRKWPVKGFEIVCVYYLVNENTLRVIRILHGKRDIDRILRRTI